MKINITLGDKDILTGYLNIDPTHDASDLNVLTKESLSRNIVKADIRNLDSHIENAECKEIIVNSVSDFLEFEDAIAAIKHWVSKLRHNGKLVIIGSDAHEICKQFLQGDIELPEFNKKIHGDFSEPWDVKMSHFTMESMSELLQSLDLNISKKRIRNTNFIVEAVRP